jgi:transposase
VSHDGFRSFICDALKLAPQSDPDAATNLELLPPLRGGEHAEQIVPFAASSVVAFLPEAIMDTLHRRCCGLDVHKDSVQACVRLIDDNGVWTSRVRSFSTMTASLLQLADWLAELEVTHVAMEATGVYWKPIWNLLEDRFELILANARHIKNVPGRKTDVADCQWIAQLLQHGLLRSSFVPDRPIREARDLTRHRTQLVGEKTRVANRIQKVLEDTNIKLASVATDILGKSGRMMLKAMIEGVDDPKALAKMALGKLRKKEGQLQLALQGRMSEHHRFQLRLLMDQLDGLEALIERIETRLDQMMKPLSETMQRLDEIPGIDVRAAQSIVSEIGTDMSRFASADHLCSWAGMCPGNHESAGKRRRGTTRPGNRWLRMTLTQCAWAASHCKNRYLSSQYRRLASRRGKKKALIAVGHSILAILYSMLKEGSHYRDLGGDWFDRQNSHRLKQHLVKRLEGLGYQVTLEARSPAA